MYEDWCLEDFIKDAPFITFRDNEGKLKIKIEFVYGLTNEFYPEQISATILKKIVEDSEFYLSEKNRKRNKN